MRDDDISGPKPRAQWTTNENTAAIYNAKALNAIFTSVDMNMFNLIGDCICARDAWKKLQTHCEGSASVKKTRMRLINSNFEKMRMEESETIMEYNGRLMSLSNESFVLGDPISNERLVSKVLRSVPKRFYTKVCAMDESKDTSIMGLDELISSLRTYEMEMEAKDDTKDLEEDSIALISKKLTDYLKVMKEKKDVKGAQPSKFPRLPTSEKPQKPSTTRGPRQRYEGKIQSSSKNFDNVQCRECKGYGHYSYECANRLRKGMNVSLSDDDSEGEQEKAEQVDLISFTALLEGKKHFQINPLGVGSGVATPGNREEQIAEAYTLEGIQTLYEEMYSDWIKRNQLNTILSKENTELKAAMARLEVLMSKKDLELGLLNSNLERAKTTLAKFNSSSNKLDTLLTMVFVKEGIDSLNHPSIASKGKKPIVEKNVSVQKPKQWKRPFVCHYCLKPGHIMPFCHKLKNDYILWESKQVLPPVLHNTKCNTGRKGPTVKKVWVQKSDVKSLKDHLTDYIEQNGGKVTYGGGAKGRIVQDQLIIATNLLGHVNFKTLKNLSKFEAVRGLPNLNSGVPYVCGACQKGKKTRVSHPVLQHCGTTQCLELLHMDLMGPMEVESYGGKKYSLGISQEFSAPKTPQQNGIAERKNRTLQEMTRISKEKTTEDDIEGLLEILL
ncbi:uncharacterized protein [Henckelia pumila]|uniref:uncharacterized protein n=1 Tax=Henckelia pumila TaxID=405737 RepID=UPI003C6DFF4A